jgi:hypothetical protein
MGEKTEGECAGLTLEFQARLDLCFKNLQIVAHDARGHAAELQVDAVHVGDDGECAAQGQNSEDDDPEFHGSGDSQLASQALLAAVHLPSVGFMIVAGQEEQAVQDEHAQHLVNAATEGTGVAPGGRRRNGNVAAAALPAK